MAGVFQCCLLILRMFSPALVALTTVTMTVTAHAADGQTPAGQSPGQVVIQSKGPGVSVNGTVASLQLSEAQRTRIAEVLATKDSEVDLNLKEHKDSKSFEAKIEEKVPKDFKGQAFPLPLIIEMPTLRQYEYLKLKGEVLVVNPLTAKIVDKFPERND